jgi:uncharacterized membrane protein YhaH (DUF805 family)
MNYYLEVLQKYVVFEGRARRSEYWYFVLFNFIISLVLGLIGNAINLPFISTIYSLAIFLPSIAVAIRRMHDVGKSGWYILIPVYNLILACTDSEVGENKYGQNPKGIGNGMTDAQAINSIGKDI